MASEADQTSGRGTGRARDRDPLVRGSDDSEPWRRTLLRVGGTLLVHGAVLALAYASSGTGGATLPEEEDESIDVEVVSSEPPEPEPEPEPTSLPEPPEPDPEPEVAPEAEPEPEPKPEPELEPEPEPEPEKPPESEADGEPESMDPVELSGINEESTVEEGEGPTIKTGDSLESGKITDNYVDPDRRDDIETGDGDGAGRGGSSTPGSGDGGGGDGGPTRKAKVRNKKRVDPEDYPVQAKRRGVEGTVVALLTIDRSGDVTDVEIKKSLGHGLDEVARKVFREWTVEPALRDGQPVESTIRITHEFRLRR